MKTRKRKHVILKLIIVIFSITVMYQLLTKKELNKVAVDEEFLKSCSLQDFKTIKERQNKNGFKYLSIKKDGKIYRPKTEEDELMLIIIQTSVEKTSLLVDIKVKDEEVDKDELQKRIKIIQEKVGNKKIYLKEEVVRIKPS